MRTSPLPAAARERPRECRSEAFRIVCRLAGRQPEDDVNPVQMRPPQSEVKQPQHKVRWIRAYVATSGLLGRPNHSPNILISLSRRRDLRDRFLGVPPLLAPVSLSLTKRTLPSRSAIL